MTDFLARLKAAFPEETYSNTFRALREGVALADDTVKGLPIFDSPIGRDLRGLIRRAGVLHRIHAMCVAGDLPFKSAVLQMPRGSWHWLEVYSTNIIAHPVRSQDPTSFPEDTPNRQDQRLRNQPDLFDDEKVVPITGEITMYAWLCYGVSRNGAITHACWNMPSAGEEEWLARINISKFVRESDASTTLTKPIKLDPKNALSFREEVLESLEKDKHEEDEEG